MEIEAQIFDRIKILNEFTTESRDYQQQKNLEIIWEMKVGVCIKVIPRISL
jgi:hypothetical protein